MITDVTSYRENPINNRIFCKLLNSYKELITKNENINKSIYSKESIDAIIPELNLKCWSRKIYTKLNWMTKLLRIFKNEVQCEILKNFNKEEFYVLIFSMLKKRNDRRQLRDCAFYLMMWDLITCVMAT